MTTTFDKLGVADDLCHALSERGIDSAFSIQEMTIPDILAGRDVCGKAKTGSGKTLAFGLPLLQILPRAKPGRPTGVAPGADPRARHAGARRAAAARARAWRAHHGDLRRRPDRQADQGPQVRCGPRRVHTWTCHRPDRAWRPVGGRRAPRGDRRGRPDGRHGVPAPGGVDLAQRRGHPPDAAVLRDPSTASSTAWCAGTRPIRHATRSSPRASPSSR